MISNYEHPNNENLKVIMSGLAVRNLGSLYDILDLNFIVVNVKKII